MWALWQAWYRTVEAQVSPWSRAHPSSAFPPEGAEVFALAVASAILVLYVDLLIVARVLRWMRPRWPLWQLQRRPLVGFALVVIPVAGFFVSVEMGLRQWVADHPSGTLWRPHPLYFWGFRPNMASARIFDYPDFTFHTNRSGFRGDDIPYAKEPNEYRILFTGDSNTFAQGVNQRDSFPMVLERMLANRYRDRKITVLNAACCGYSLSQSFYLFDEEGARYTPDLVIVGSHKWSITEDHLRMRERIASNAILRRLQVWASDLVLYQLLRKEIDLMRGVQPIDLTREDFGSAVQRDAQYFTYCSRFVERCRALGAAVIVVAPPPPSVGAADLWQGGELGDFKRRFTPQDRVAFMTWHQEQPDEVFCIRPNDRHFSVAANLNMARQFFDFIVSSGIIR